MMIILVLVMKMGFSRRFHSLLPKYDVVLVADYGHGMLSQSAVDLLCEESPYLAVNAQAKCGGIADSIQSPGTLRQILRLHF